MSSKTDLKRSVRIPGVHIPEDAPILAIVDDGRDLRVISADGRITRFEVGYAEDSPAILISTEEGVRRTLLGGDIHHVVTAFERLRADLHARGSSRQRATQARSVGGLAWTVGALALSLVASSVMLLVLCNVPDADASTSVVSGTTSLSPSSTASMPPPVVPASALPAAAPGDVAPAACPFLEGADGESTSAQAPLVKAQLATAEGAPPVVTLPPIIIEGEALTDIAPAETETLDPSDPAAAQAALASLQDARRVIDNGGKLSPQDVAKLPHDLARSLHAAGLVSESAGAIVRVSPATMDKYRDRNGIATIPEMDSWTAAGGRVMLPLPGGGNIAGAEDIAAFGLEP